MKKIIAETNFEQLLLDLYEHVYDLDYQKIRFLGRRVSSMTKKELQISLVVTQQILDNLRESKR